MSEFIADDLKHASLKYYSIGFKDEQSTIKFVESGKKLKTFSVDKTDGNRVNVSFEDSDLNAVIALASDLGATEFSNRRESLEDYFMKFYKEDKDFGGALK